MNKCFKERVQDINDSIDEKQSEQWKQEMSNSNSERKDCQCQWYEGWPAQWHEGWHSQWNQ